jgi:hypothetical protein
MSVIHDKGLFIRTYQLIKKGNTHYGFYQLKKHLFNTSIYLAYFVILRFFGVIESNWPMLIFYCILLMIALIASFFFIIKTLFLI